MARGGVVHEVERHAHVPSGCGCNFTNEVAVIFTIYVALVSVHPGGAWRPWDVNFAENELWGFCSGRGEPLVISWARLFLFAEKKTFSAMSSDSQRSHATLITMTNNL